MKLFLALNLIALTAFAADPQYIDTTAGAGDSGRAGGVKINNNLSNLVTGNLSLTNPPIVGGLSVDGTIIASNATLTTVTGTTVHATTLVGNLAYWATNASVIYVATNGNDSTAIRGRSDYPWKTPSIAVTNMVDGDKMILLAGNHVIETKNATNTWADTEGTFILSNKSNCEIIGEGATLYTDDYGDMLTLHSCTNITITGIRFQGTSPSMEASSPNTAAILFRGTNYNIDVHHNSFYNVANQGVSGYLNSHLNRQVKIRNNHFENIGTPNALTIKGWPDGAAISGIGHSFYITDNTMMRCYRGVELNSGPGSGANAFITNVVVRGNIIESNFAECIYADSYYWDADIQNNHIYNCIATNGAYSMYGIAVIRGTRFNIANNFIKGLKRSVGNAVCLGIFVSRGTNITINGNDVSDLGTSVAPGIGIHVEGTTTALPAVGVNIMNNVIHDCNEVYSTGIIIGYGAGLYNYEVKVIGNSVYNTRSETFLFSGISVRGGSNILVTANSVYDTRWPVTEKLLLSGLYISPVVTNIVIGDNDFSGVKILGITNACKTNNYKFISMQDDSYKTNQVYW